MSLSIAAVTFDCVDAAAQARFWGELLGRAVDPEASEFFASIGRTSGEQPVLMFLKVGERNPGKNVVHLDLYATDRQAEIDRAIGLGAEHRGDFDEYGIVWTTLADPEGNLFDIAAQA
ncbi:VOC family protein [Nocardia higoensis]|uniref:VOC family protein n=1 Tax=Nocardia higoensis TaxID=228599 RepID=A0ABS0DJ61_9NOCA|nr:VOC family protein [Nocardia higoensis]MBF6357948.1 VOC family protein [Nocardia higoensis]